jgi:3-oxoacyl-[acyl-carrier protein] reductase
MTRPSALIAGGSTGIGFAIATVLVEDGWDVTIAARDEAKLAAAGGAAHRSRAPCAASQSTSRPRPRRPRSLSTSACTAGSTCSSTSAGVCLIGPLETKSAKAVDLEIALNLRAAYRLMQQAVPALRKSA